MRTVVLQCLTWGTVGLSVTASLWMAKTASTPVEPPMIAVPRLSNTPVPPGGTSTAAAPDKAEPVAIVSR